MLLGGGGGDDAIAFKPPKADVPLVCNWRSCLIVAVTLHFETVVSAGKVANLQRVGMLSSLGKFSIFQFLHLQLVSSLVRFFLNLCMLLPIIVCSG